MGFLVCKYTIWQPRLRQMRDQGDQMILGKNTTQLFSIKNVFNKNLPKRLGLNWVFYVVIWRGCVHVGLYICTLRVSPGQWPR
jgi:hypothetical protein